MMDVLNKNLKVWKFEMIFEEKKILGSFFSVSSSRIFKLFEDVHLCRDIHIRAVVGTKWSSEPLIKVISCNKRIILRPIWSKLVVLYYAFSGQEAL